MQTTKQYSEKLRKANKYPYNEYGVEISRKTDDWIFWRSLNIDKANSFGVDGFLEEHENGPRCPAVSVNLTSLNFNKYFTTDYQWADFICDLKKSKEASLREIADNDASLSVSDEQLYAPEEKITFTELRLFTSAKFNNKYSKADDYFVFDRLYKDDSGNIYFKLQDKYHLLKFKINDERCLTTGTFGEDSDFWAAFFAEFSDDINKWNKKIMETVRNTDFVTNNFETSLMKNGVPRIYIETLSVKMMYKEYFVEEAKRTIKEFVQCILLPNTGNQRSSWNYGDKVQAFSRSLMQAVDISKVKRIVQFSNDAAEPALLHIQLPKPVEHDDYPVLPPTWGRFLDDNRFWNPIVDRLKIAKFVMNTLDAHYSGRQSLVLSGEGHDGKGIFLDVMNSIMTNDLCVALNVNAFAPEDRFQLFSILNKKLIMLTDCRSVSKLFATDKFKQVTGHDLLTLEQKHAKAVNYKAKNVTIAIATNAPYYINMAHGRTRVLPIVFRKNYTKKTFIDKNEMTCRLTAERQEFLQWCSDYVHYMKKRHPGLFMCNEILNCCDADLDKLDILDEDQLFINMCQSETLGCVPCCKWNERSADEEADAEVFSETMNAWMESWSFSHPDIERITLSDIISTINQELADRNAMQLKLIFNGNCVKMTRTNQDYKNLVHYFEENKKYVYSERKMIDGKVYSKLIEIPKQKTSIDEIDYV